MGSVFLHLIQENEAPRIAAEEIPPPPLPEVETRDATTDDTKAAAGTTAELITELAEPSEPLAKAESPAILAELGQRGEDPADIEVGTA